MGGSFDNVPFETKILPADSLETVDFFGVKSEIQGILGVRGQLGLDISDLQSALECVVNLESRM